MQDCLLIFIKNPVAGKVKTRLAKVVGDEKALMVYRHLLDHTRQLARQVEQDKRVCYSDFIPGPDEWDLPGFSKVLQQGEDLGARMNNAFQQAFLSGCRKCVIIGSDCPELDREIVERAFSLLDQHDVVLGPAKDGGYYLLGMKSLHRNLFVDKSWSTGNVLQETLASLEKGSLSFTLLPELSDIDEVSDLVNFPEIRRIAGVEAPN